MQEIKLHIWDTGGQEQFRSMTSLYFRDADAALICYDVGQARTFDSISYWAEQMDKNCNKPRDEYVLACAGNKCDLEDSKKQVPLSQASAKSKELGMIFHETSAKSGTGVDDLFNDLIREIIISKRRQ